MKEAKWIGQLQAGDRFALNYVMDEYTPYLSAVVWHVMGPAATAQDVEEVVSDAFLALWSHRKTLEAEKIRKSVYSILRQEQREQQPHRKPDMER